MKKLIFLFSFVFAVTTISFDAFAEEGAQEPGVTEPTDEAGLDSAWWEWRSTIVARLNPLGLIAANELAYRYTMYDHESSVLENNFVGIVFQPWVSPGWFRPGLKLEIQPASIMNLSVSYEYIFNFGTFGLVQSFQTPDAEYSDTALDEGEARGDNYTPVGKQLTLAGLLQAKVGPIAVRNNLKLQHTNYPLNDGDTVYYDQLVDLLLPGQGWSYVDDVDLLYVSDFGLVAGVRYTVSNAFYGDEFNNPNGPTHRIGPLVTYKFFDNPDQRLSEVTGILLANWWLKHRYRTGEDTPQALPYLGLGVRLGGRLF